MGMSRALGRSSDFPEASQGFLVGRPGGEDVMDSKRFPSSRPWKAVSDGFFEFGECPPPLPSKCFGRVFYVTVRSWEPWCYEFVT